MIVLKISDRFKNRKVDWFTNVRLGFKYDCIANDFSLDYYFDPDNFEHKEFSCVGHFHLCTLEYNGKVIMTGIILSIQFIDEPQKKLARISGYSLPGVLQDCSIAKSSYPLQSDGLSLTAIVDKLLKPFNIKYVIDQSVRRDMDIVFSETEAGQTQSVQSYLTELATSRNIIISNDTQGRVVFTRLDANKTAIFHFEQNIPGVSMTLGFNGQAMHSDILAVMQADPDDPNAVEAPPVQNPYVPIVFRPQTIVVNSGDGLTVQRAADNAIAAELKNVTLIVSLDRFQIGEVLFLPGEFITVTNPQVYLYKKTKWIIESVDFTGDSAKEVAVLRCVPPEVYTGKKPQYIWKGINIHFPG